jgi:hypothetical protein
VPRGVPERTEESYGFAQQHLGILTTYIKLWFGSGLLRDGAVGDSVRLCCQVLRTPRGNQLPNEVIRRQSRGAYTNARGVSYRRKFKECYTMLFMFLLEQQSAFVHK